MSVKSTARSSSRWRPAPRGSRTAVLIALFVVLIGGLGVVAAQMAHHQDKAPVHTAQAATPASSFAIPGCYSRTVPPDERPAKLKIVGCASVAVALQDLVWSSWGPQGADGTGVAVFKVCDPNCAAGYQLTDDVVVHAWNPQPPRANSGCREGVKIFADLILAFGKGVPPPAVQKMNAQYNGMPAAHFTNYPADSPDRQFIGYTFCS